MALTKPKPIKSRSGNIYMRKLKAGTKIYTGALVLLDGGFAVAGKTATGLIADGVARDMVDNTNGADGDVSVPVEHGMIWGFLGSGVTEADIGKDAYVIDDDTVAADNGGATRSQAGKIIDVAKGLVWVKL